MAAARDGSLSVAFGLGKYVNRNVMDAFAGVSRRHRAVDGAGQPQARADARGHRVGPDHLRDHRAAAAHPHRARAPTTSSPISFDVEIDERRPAGGRGPRDPRQPQPLPDRRRRRALPPERRRRPAGSRSRASGSRSTRRTWVGARDRSWGVRYGVGQPLGDLEEAPVPPGTSTLVLWMPVTMTRPTAARTRCSSTTSATTATAGRRAARRGRSSCPTVAARRSATSSRSSRSRTATGG